IRHKTFIQKLPSTKPKKVPAIPGLPDTTEVIEIMTSDLPQYHRRRELLYYDSVAEKNENHFLDEECVVELEEAARGKLLLAWITKANARGRYHLHIPNSPMMTDVKIKSAHPILATRKV